MSYTCLPSGPTRSHLFAFRILAPRFPAMRQEPPATLFSPPRHPVPAGTGTVGMILFLLALAMLFGSSLLGYLLIRYTTADAPAAGSINVPWGLWVSTLVIIVSSVTMHSALGAVQRERQTSFRRWMTATFALAILFLLVQTPAMLALVNEHMPRVQEYREALDQARAQGRMQAGLPMPVGGLVFLLVFVHAMHVLGGLIPLAVITFKALRDRYDHEHFSPVKHITMYWHFLGAVWIVMFITLLLAS